MDDSEKNAWLQVLLIMWGMPLAAFATSALMPGPNAELGARGFAWFLIASTGAYLLILSWRAAYLSGRKKR